MISWGEDTTGNEKYTVRGWEREGGAQRSSSGDSPAPPAQVRFCVRGCTCRRCSCALLLPLNL